jgi:hypothetical protein
MQTTTKTKKISRIQRRIFLGAIILALLVHGVLLVLFEYAPAKKIYSNTRTAGVTFMNLASQPPAKRRKLLNWLDYHEPSLISAPNEKYGYNQLNPYVDFRAAYSDKVHQTVLPDIPEKKPKEFTFLKIHNQGEDVLSQNFIFKRPHQVTVETPKPVLPDIKYPLLKNGNKILPLSFSPYLLKDSQKLKAKAMLINYNLEQSKILPRVVIVNSSGNYDFDMLVLRELSLHIDDIALGSKDFTISIQWRGEGK